MNENLEERSFCLQTLHAAYLNQSSTPNIDWAHATGLVYIPEFAACTFLNLHLSFLPKTDRTFPRNRNASEITELQQSRDGTIGRIFELRNFKTWKRDYRIPQFPLPAVPWACGAPKSWRIETSFMKLWHSPGDERRTVDFELLTARERVNAFYFASALLDLPVGRRPITDHFSALYTCQNSRSF